MGAEAARQKEQARQEEIRVNEIAEERIRQ